MIRRLFPMLARAWVLSLRPRFAPGAHLPLPPSGILVLWHSDMLACLRAFSKNDMRVLISSSADGDFGAEAARRLGYRVVRGSSSRGGADALLRIARTLRKEGGWIAIVADGPRGPREACKPGAVWLSRHTNLPVVCVRTRARLGFTLGGWAKVRVPLPFAAVDIRISTPLHPETTEEIEEVMSALLLIKNPEET